MEKKYNFPTVDILGLKISRLGLIATLNYISNVIEKGDKIFVAHPNSFIIMEINRNPVYRKAFHRVDLATADGMPIVWASYILGERIEERVSGADFFELMLKRSVERGYTCYFLGGGPVGGNKLIRNLEKKFPKLKIVGNKAPISRDVSPGLSKNIVKEINSLSPDILWVGLGSPYQENWVSNYIDNLDINVALGVGASFWYFGGIKKRAPYWMRRIGLEWMYRILGEDINLFWKKRYYAIPIEFILPIIFQSIKRRLNDTY